MSKNINNINSIPELVDIEKLSEHDATLYTALMFFKRNQITLEQALMLAIAALVNEKDSLTKQLVEIIENTSEGARIPAGLPKH